MHETAKHRKRDNIITPLCGCCNAVNINSNNTSLNGTFGKNVISRGNALQNNCDKRMVEYHFVRIPRLQTNIFSVIIIMIVVVDGNNSFAEAIPSSGNVTCRTTF